MYNQKPPKISIYMNSKFSFSKIAAAIVIASSYAAFTAPAYAWDFNPNIGTGSPIGEPIPIPVGRPKAPGIYDVYAQVKGGTLTVLFVRPAGVCVMNVTSDSDPIGQTYSFPSEMPFSTTVDSTDPKLSLEIVTDDGTTYSGEIQVE